MATTTLLVLKSDFMRHMGLHWAGTATGGSASTLIDSTLIGLSSEVWPTTLEGAQIRVTSGSAAGDLRVVARVSREDGTLFPNRNFSAAVASTNTYELWGNSIYGGASLTDLFNDQLRRLRPVIETQITIVTNKTQYDVTTLVQTATDIERVYLRVLDPASLAPYYLKNIQWSARDLGGGGTTSVILTIPPQTLNTAVNELWLRGRTAFTAFSTTVDTGTIDAVYRDWIVWEAIYAFAQRMADSQTGNKNEWTARLNRAKRELATLRKRFVPHGPTLIRATAW